MKALSVFEKGSREYEKLVAFCERFNEMAEAEAVVKTIYFDYGQNWKFTTLVEDYQILTPKLQEMVLNGSDDEVEMALEESVEIYRRINGGK